MEKQNAIEEVRDSLKYLWLHRKGNDAHAAVQDVIDAKYPKKELKPLILKKIKDGDSWRFLINLPPGTGFLEFKKISNLFSDAIGGSVHIEKRGKVVTMEVIMKELEKHYPFSEFDASKYPDMYLPFPIGRSAKGLIVRDLAKYPHFFLGGETDFGKSNMLHVIANSILLYRPESFVIIVDPKSTEFAYLDDKALVIDEMGDVGELLEKLNEEMDKRKKILKSKRCVKISKYLDKGFQMDFITLIIDEWADLPEEVQVDLWRLLRMGRFVGIHVVAATQRPSSKIFDRLGDMKAMFLGRMSFITADAINSRMILDCDDSAFLPAIRGRAIYKCGLEMMEVQTLFLDPEEAEKLYKGTAPRKVVNPIAIEQLPKMLPPR
ncbi:MAG: FtsK/SpoIIIE family protein [Candidatus Moranbacteria bacterium GW2011_GWF1_36_4]|nr:MAG: FtsK/SpoIIIE family protein [Candidatus Moranbacteria bacterium GW2011_GWF1_36_4]